MLTAIGEALTCEDDPPRTKEFTAFIKEYGADRQFRRWFADLDKFLSEANPNNALQWDRLIAARPTSRHLFVSLILEKPWSHPAL